MKCVKLVRYLGWLYCVIVDIVSVVCGMVLFDMSSMVYVNSVVCGMFVYCYFNSFMVGLFESVWV